MVSHHYTYEAAGLMLNCQVVGFMVILTGCNLLIAVNFLKKASGSLGLLTIFFITNSISILPRPDPIRHNGKGQHSWQMFDFHFSWNGSTLVLLVSVWLFSSITAFNTESLESRFTSISPPPHSSLDVALSFKCKLSNSTAGSDGHYFHEYPRQRSQWSGATGVKGSILRWRD